MDRLKSDTYDSKGWQYKMDGQFLEIVRSVPIYSPHRH